MGIVVAERKFFGEIGSLDGGMKIYGGENVELGIRVKSDSFEHLDYSAICSCDVVRLVFYRSGPAAGASKSYPVPKSPTSNEPVSLIFPT